MARTKKRRSSKRTAKRRASWKGNLTFGLVSFPVQAFNARNAEQSDVHFHQLHAECHRRIRYAKMCPVHGEVTNDEIISGYEYAKGKYVEIEPEELDVLRTQHERSLTIDAFIEPDVIDPLYFDGRMYYLAPANESANEPYFVMAEALEREEQYGVGSVVFSGKEQLALLRPLDGVLHMAMLNYHNEIKDPHQAVAALKKPRSMNRQVQLAQALIRNWSSKDFDFEQYEDRYRAKVKHLINAKVEGREVVAADEDEEEPEVVNLLDALKRSVAATGGRRKTSRSRKRAG